MYHDINFCENSFSVQTFSDYERKIQAYKLRHQVFAETLKWVAENPDGLEYDEYDAHAVHFGVFNKHNELTSYMRLIMPDNEFMLEKIDVFRKLLPNGFALKKDSAAEISRFCTRSNSRNTLVKTQMRDFFQSICLSKGVYHWCNMNNIKYLYAITEYRIYRLFKSYGFPFETIGEDFHVMPDGTKIVVMVLDWRLFEKISIEKNKEFYSWFIKYPLSQRTREISPSQPSAADLLCPVLN
jgi:N-acyl amino acid synthase of PEP-CTERM/exosortase system